MENDRLPKKAYEMLVGSDRNGKDCWASRVRELLCETGVNCVWLQQGVGDVMQFLTLLKQRLVDMFIQEWSGAIRDKDILLYDNYQTVKAIFQKEKYISSIDIIILF